MQQLTDHPREGIAPELVSRLITDSDTIWSFGAERLSATLSLLEDISDDLLGGSITWTGPRPLAAPQDGAEPDTGAEIHRACTLQLSRTLSWGLDRVKVYAVAEDPARGLQVRFNLGVFVPSTPTRPAADDPVTYEVHGQDLNALLAAPYGDTLTVVQNTLVLDKVAALVKARVPGATVLLDSAGAAKKTPEDLVWAITESEQPTVLRIVNELLKSVGYEPLWVDQEGRFRAVPQQDDATRSVEWVFNADEVRTIVGPERTLTEDVWAAKNAWRIYASGLSFPAQEGNGLYTPPEYLTGGPTAQDQIGRNLRVAFVDAADQASLVAAGDAIVAADKRVTSQIQLTTYPFPLAGHRDVVRVVDGALGDPRKMVATSWTFSLGDGGVPADTDWALEKVA